MNSLYFYFVPLVFALKIPKICNSENKELHSDHLINIMTLIDTFKETFHGPFSLALLITIPQYFVFEKEVKFNVNKNMLTNSM